MNLVYSHFVLVCPLSPTLSFFFPKRCLCLIVRQLAVPTKLFSRSRTAFVISQRRTVKSTTATCPPIWGRPLSPRGPCVPIQIAMKRSTQYLPIVSVSSTFGWAACHSRMISSGSSALCGLLVLSSLVGKGDGVVGPLACLQKVLMITNSLVKDLPVPWDLTFFR